MLGTYIEHYGNINTQTRDWVYFPTGAQVGGRNTYVCYPNVSGCGLLHCRNLPSRYRKVLFQALRCLATQSKGSYFLIGRLLLEKFFDSRK
jgi:hypothetical protein